MGHSQRGLVCQARELRGLGATSAPQAEEVTWVSLDKSSVWLPCWNREIKYLDGPGVGGWWWAHRGWQAHGRWWAHGWWQAHSWCRAHRGARPTGGSIPKEKRMEMANRDGSNEMHRWEQESEQGRSGTHWGDGRARSWDQPCGEEGTTSR